MKLAACIAFTAIIGLGACQQKKHVMTESEKKAKVDSLVGVRMEEINRQAMEDLDHRMSIEVKAKADSIVAAATGATATTPNTALPAKAEP